MTIPANGADLPAPQRPPVTLDPAAVSAVGNMARQVGIFTAKTVTGMFEQACWQFVEEWTTGDPEQREALYVAFWRAAGREVRAFLEAWLADPPAPAPADGPAA